MPDIDGYTATKEIRKLDINRQTPIIAMTAYATAEDREKCMEAGMDDYISKPINIETTLKIINKYINNLSENRVLTNIDTNFTDIVNKISNHTGLSREKSARILNKFIDMLPDTINSMNEDLKKEDFIDLRNLAHSLKGTSGNLMLQDLYNAAFELEKLSKLTEKTACMNILTEIEKRAEKLIATADLDIN